MMQSNKSKEGTTDGHTIKKNEHNIGQKQIGKQLKKNTINNVTVTVNCKFCIT